MAVAAGRELDDGREQGASIARAYANYLSIGHTMSEVLLDFGQFFGTGAEPDYHTRIVTSPLHLRSFHELMMDAIASYEREFGPLPDDALPMRRQ
jgi:Protein of unknown function (DUF3467)